MCRQGSQKQNEWINQYFWYEEKVYTLICPSYCAKHAHMERWLRATEKLGLVKIKKFGPLNVLILGGFRVKGTKTPHTENLNYINNKFKRASISGTDGGPHSTSAHA